MSGKLESLLCTINILKYSRNFSLSTKLGKSIKRVKIILIKSN